MTLLFPCLARVLSARGEGRSSRPIIGIDDKNGINACKLLGIAFTTAIGILLRSREKGLLDGSAALAGLAALARYGRYKNSIIEDARLKLEVRE